MSVSQYAYKNRKAVKLYGNANAMKNETITIRASKKDAALIRKAAEIKGCTVSEFVMLSLRDRAENIVRWHKD